MLRALIAGLALLASAGGAYAQGANNPYYTREQQGSTIDQFDVSCDTSSTLLYSSAASGDVRSITVSNEGSNPVYICTYNSTSPAPTPTPVACTTGTAVAVLGANESLTIDRSAKGIRLTCIATGAASLVVGFAERG